MPKRAVKLTYECVEQLECWIRANCPSHWRTTSSCPGLHVIVEMEVETALQRQQATLLKRLRAPSIQ